MVTVRSKAQVIVGYVRMETFTCAVFHVFSCVEECSKVRFSERCKLLFLRLFLFFNPFVILYCCVVSEADTETK